jgi:hypothetical protein
MGEPYQTTTSKRYVCALAPTNAFDAAATRSTGSDTLCAYREQLRLTQHPTIGIDTSSRPPSPRRYHRALPQSSGLQVQLRKDDLPQVLRSSATPCNQLPKEEVRPHQPAAAEEEDQVIFTLHTKGGTRRGVLWRRSCFWAEPMGT